MKYRLTVLSLLCTLVFLQGCETIRGAAEGFKRDIEQLTSGEGELNKADAWMQEHLW